MPETDPGPCCPALVGRLMTCAFFTSGAVALLDEITWRRLLVLVVGGDAQSVAVVTAAFMTGLGVGSLAGGHLADRLSPRGQILLFAASELGIGIFTFLSADIFYYGLYQRLEGYLLSDVTIGLLAFSALLCPTFFMGMSLPLLARAMSDDARNPARRAVVLYAWNAIGGGIGAVLTVTVVSRMMSIPDALHVSALLSTACAAAAWSVRRRFPADGPEAAMPVRLAPIPPVVNRPALAQWIAIYAVSGFIALSLEMVWIRLLGIIIHTNAFTFGVVLAVYVACIGVGTLIGTHRRLGRVSPETMFFALQAGVTLYAVLSLAVLVALSGQFAFAQPLWDYWGHVPRATFGQVLLGTGGDAAAGASLFGTLALLVTVYGLLPLFLIGPPTLMMGMSFCSLQRVVQTELTTLGRRLGWLQAANIGGAVLGIVATNVVLLDRIGSAGTLRVLAVLGGTFMVILAVRARNRRSLRLVAAVAVTALAVLAVPSKERLWVALHAAVPGTMVVAEDMTGVSAIRRRSPDSSIVVANGIAQSDLPFGGGHTVLGALPALMHPSPALIAVIGLGSGDTVFSIGARRETRSIDCVEIVAPELPTLRRWAQQEADPGLRALFRDPRVRYWFGDGRKFIAASGRRYDIIEADALRANAAFAGYLYSTEYFELLRRHLNRGGFVVSWAPTVRTRHTFIKSFPYTVVVGEILIGSDDPLTFDPHVIRRRLEEPFTRTRFLEAKMDIATILEEALSMKPVYYGLEVDRSAVVDVNADLFPKDEFMIGQPAFRLPGEN